MESIWTMSTNIPQRKPLLSDISVQAVVIGAGIAGILTAYLLKESGLSTVILEADRISCGQTKNTTAKITSQHGLFYQKLKENFGDENAFLFARASENAIENYRRIIREKHIPCQFEELPSYLYSTSDDVSFLIREAKTAASLGINASFTHETSLPFPVFGAARFERQAQFHPLEFIRALSKDLDIYEHTPALSVEEHLVRTSHGNVHAKYIIIASHYPFINRPGYYFLRMHQERSYVLAVENAAKLDGMYISADQGGLTFRNRGSLLILGGLSHRTGKNAAGGKYGALAKYAAEYYPQSPVRARWSAQDCMTLDGLPYIGKFSRKYEDIYVATGFGKWGMTNSMVAASLIRDEITGIENPLAPLLSPGRHTLRASCATFLCEGAESAVNLSKELFYIPSTRVEDLKAGEGGIVRNHGKKIGAYRDEDGTLYYVSVKCPHLGCQLTFNPDEKTWDCPCHGSRFDYRGNLLDDPAVDGITEKNIHEDIHKDIHQGRNGL